MPAGYELDLLSTVEQFQALEPEWRCLYQEGEPRNPFLSYEWTVACWRHACGGSRLFILTARQAGRLVGIAPLRLAPWFGFRVVWFIGNGWSDYTGFLCAADHPEVERLLLESLASTPGWDMAYFRQLSRTYTGLVEARLPVSLRHRHSIATVAPYLSIGKDWQALCTSGPPAVRRAQRSARKWEREGGTVERHAGGEAARFMAEVVEIEARSWKVHGGKPRFQRGPGERLVGEVLSRLAPRGEMELWLARMSGRPVAFQINLLTPERLWYYLSAFDEEYRRFYPGGLLHFHALRHAWKQGRREYDFLTGGDAYKGAWTNAQRSQEYLVLYPATLRGAAAFHLLIAPRWRLRHFAPARVALQTWNRWQTQPRRPLRAVAGRQN